MKQLPFFILAITLSIATMLAQTVSGRIILQSGEGVGDANLSLYIHPNIYTTTTSENGSFVFDGVTSVVDASIPTGYSVSVNYPNPFNPTTRFIVGIPATSNIGVEVFNILGQKVIGDIEGFYSAGNHTIDIELNGLPNGIYISRVTFNDKHTFVKKMMLLYGSQHLQSSSISSLMKRGSSASILSTTIDSIVVSGGSIILKTFTGLSDYDGSSLTLGDLIVEKDSTAILYVGKYYKTVQIGNQIWLKVNLDVGTMIISNSNSVNQTNNSIIEKFCYNNDTKSCIIYGGLYQWNEVMQYTTTEGTQGICPPGWHVPSDAEFVMLSVTVGESSNALKAIGQGSDLGAGTNTSGFSALLSGDRYVIDGGFNFLGRTTHFWSSTEGDISYAGRMRLGLGSDRVNFSPGGKDDGFSVRCVKD
ncbi:MAG: T9SS type A sorting domain-containing protein [Bacteroidetes bacterium]|nr:T9SS type A sorting domain-containing protein [Bacteroidota bacterium]